MKSKQFTVSTLFYAYHKSLGKGLTGKVIQAGELLTVVELDETAYDDLFNDADYYASFAYTQNYEENKLLVDSAIETIKQLLLTHTKFGY